MHLSKVVALKTTPRTVLDDYVRLLELSELEKHLDKKQELLLKLNLSWTKYFPACSTQPWQLEGVLRYLFNRGFTRDQILPVENKTVVTDPIKGAHLNKWLPILKKFDLSFISLPDQKWIGYDFGNGLLRLRELFPEGIEIPAIYPGKQILHLPTLKTHGHSITTGAVKNAFGGLLKEVRHYAHKYIHEVLVELMIMQKKLHPVVFAVMDGTVAGNGAGPRTIQPVAANLILASSDSVAIDALAAKIMGFDPLSIPYLRMCQERELGIADPKDIEIVGDDLSGVNLQFSVKRSFVIWGDQLLRKGALHFLEKIALHSPLMVWAPFASWVYHDLLWYPTVGRYLIRRFRGTDWGQLFEKYPQN